MDISTCPICYLRVASIEIDRHANDHFDDEQLDQDFELAKQIALAPPSPLPVHVDDSIWDEATSSKCNTKASAFGVKEVDEKISCLLSLQMKEAFYSVEGGLIGLLKKCLESESENSLTLLSGHVDHFQSNESEDAGWGCGWRNIQMLSSHLLKQRPEAREVLYGGSGFVPDIASLQRWLEIAWKRGFDSPGSDDFNREIYGKKNWIGTTECAALLRSFGIRAMIVDFCSKDVMLASSLPSSSKGTKRISGYGSKRREVQVHGQMDSFLSRAIDNRSPQIQSGLDKFKDSAVCSGRVKGHNVLIDWIWNYFSDNNFTKSSGQLVILSGKAPLYFQHDGHSRTIIGIQIKRQRNNIPQFNLLILDPAHKTESLANALKKNSGWQKLIKRGVHTLKKPQYQLCFTDPGVAYGEELESLKTLRSIRLELNQ